MLGELDRVLVSLTDGVSWKLVFVVIPDTNLLWVAIDPVLLHDLVEAVVINIPEVLKQLGSLEQEVLHLPVTLDVSLLLLAELDHEVVDSLGDHGDLDGWGVVVEGVLLVLLYSGLSPGIVSFKVTGILHGENSLDHVSLKWVLNDIEVFLSVTVFVPRRYVGV